MEPDPTRPLADIVHEAQKIANSQKKTVIVEYKFVKFQVQFRRMKKNENQN
jgi:hypothetical protein